MKLNWFIGIILVCYSKLIYSQTCESSIVDAFDFFDYDDDYYGLPYFNEGDSLFLLNIKECIKYSKEDSIICKNTLVRLISVLQRPYIPHKFGNALFELYFYNFKSSNNYFSTVLSLGLSYKMSNFRENLMSKKIVCSKIYTDQKFNKLIKLEMLESDFFLGEWKQVEPDILKRFFESCDRSISLRKMRCKTKSKAIRNGISEMELYIKQNNLK